MPRPGDREQDLDRKINEGKALGKALGSALGLARAPFGAVAAFLVPTLLPVRATPAAVVEAPGGGAPMYYLRTFGSPGNEITELAWGVTWLSLGVVLIITALVVLGVALRARRVADMRTDAHSVTRARDERALPWIYAGIIATVAALAFFTTWTVGSMAAIQAPDEAPAATIDVTAHQWWWEIAYKDEDGSTIFETANEIHIPVGRPVRFVLRSPDVIHSFWVPLLAGKTDMIPGQENTAWLRADTPGVYRGQCLEYCGRQHAHMSFLLLAVPPDEFQAWLDRQRARRDGQDGDAGTGGRT